jgi:hypothetical protein
MNAQPATGEDYADEVARTDNAADALKAIRRMTRAQETVEAARIERDEAITAMYLRDGLTAPQISRALDGAVSTSLVRLTLRVAGAL